MNIDYSQFLNMVPEVSLVAILIITFIIDLFSVGKKRTWFNPLLCVLMLAHIVIKICPSSAATTFSGMYYTNTSVGVIKTILALGALIVIIQSKEWLSRKDTSFKEGEFYMLLVSTLLGMNVMVSANHFLLFFLGLEMASVPMACLIAIDKWRKNSAEAGAKFILTATFSSGVMLYGISFLYGSVGTLYFNDVAAKLATTPLTIMGMVFFLSGLSFKISLVPFHLWTADTFQGAPTTVAGYLSVVSKGAAVFTLCAILMKVFAPMVEYWEYLLAILVVLSITVGNLFAIRQAELKRFMAFSSISQAGYIVLSIIGNSSFGIAALSYYVLIYVVANLCVFTIISAIEQHNDGVTDIAAYNGLYGTNPKLAFLMTIALFSLGGIPPFAGMFSKFFVFMAAAKQGSILAYVVVFIALVNTVVSLYYYLLIVKAMYINKSDSPLPAFRTSVNTKIALIICTIGIVAFGVFSVFYDWIETASIS